MPDGKTHTRLHQRYIPYATAVGVGLATLSGRPSTGAAFVVGYIAGLLIEPDLDMVGITESERRAMRWLVVLAVPWLFWWSIYAALPFFRHRSLLTHYPLLSTLIRLLWLFVPVLFISGVMRWDVQPFLGALLSREEAWVFAFGLSLSDLVHDAADRGWSASRS